MQGHSKVLEIRIFSKMKKEREKKTFEKKFNEKCVFVQVHGRKK